MSNRQILVTELPTGALGQDHFKISSAAMPEPARGEVLVKTLLISIDAAMRAWMRGATYRAPVRPGDTMPCFALSVVVDGNGSGFQAGDLVSSESVCAEYAALPADELKKEQPIAPLTHLMSVYSIAGKTAFHGLINVGRAVAGETLLVSGAAGSVGSFVGQIGKAIGCRVVGIAGGAQKCAWVTEELGFDACVDYRGPSMYKALRSACPDGVDVYFDNVGGEILETALPLMNERGRIACCGAISQYDAASASGPRNLPGILVVKRLRMEGFIVSDFLREEATAMRALQSWVDSGQIKVVEDIIDGLENVPSALIGLLGGDNRGKRMVRVAESGA